MQDLAHLLNRVTFGPRPGDLEHVQSIGAEQFLDEQLHPERIDDTAIEEHLAFLTSLRMSVAELRGVQPPRQILVDLQSQKIIRAVHSQCQLQEVMTDFWFNHFNVFWQKNADRWLTTAYEMNAIRPHVFGKFKDLLTATAKSPAMLVYLDNHLSSSIKGINENYARELMELHTLGVDGGYTQHDVQEVARALTGWSIAPPPRSASPTGRSLKQRGGEFMFRPRMHDDGEKVVLGHKINAGGIHDGETVIDILAKHPSTARFIAMKLVRKFVADEPPAPLVKHVADVYKSTEGSIREMLHAIFTSREFNLPEAVGAKTKTPLEYVASAIRSLDGSTDGSRPLAQQLSQSIARMGQPLYQCQPPTGYPDRGDYWMSNGAILERLNFAVTLSTDRSVIKRLGSPEFQKR